MSVLIYLGFAIVVSVIGSVVIWARSSRPQSLESGVQDFARGLQALAGESGPAGSRRSG